MLVVVMLSTEMLRVVSHNNAMLRVIMLTVVMFSVVLSSGLIEQVACLRFQIHLTFDRVL
jgi:hypothetical protein